MSGVFEIFLDKCPRCEGIWADARESSQVAAHMKADPKVKALAEGILRQDKQREGYHDLAELNKVPLFYWVFLPRIILPLADDTPRQKFPYITIAIIAACFLSFLGQLSVGRDEIGYLMDFGFVPAKFFSIGLITSMFLHGGWLHLGGNMFFLWLFGDNIEDRLSRGGYLGFYLLCGVVANMAHGIFNLGAEIPCVGASGAISGMMGAYLVFFPHARIKTLFFFRIIHIPAYFFLGLWLLLQFFDLAVSNILGSTSVAWYAHIGGFLFGAVFAWGYKRIVVQKASSEGQFRLLKEE